MKILFQGDGSSDDPGRWCPGETEDIQEGDRGAGQWSRDEVSDSQTDVRDPDDFCDLGDRYEKYAAVMFTDAYPDMNFSFYRGDMGDGEIPDLVCVLPDFLGRVSDEEYEASLIRRLSALRQNENIRVLVLEPFLAREEDSALRDRVDDRVNATRRAATGNADILVPLDGLFAAERIAHPDIDYADENGLTPEGYCFLGECCFRAAAPIIASFREKEAST